MSAPGRRLKLASAAVAVIVLAGVVIVVLGVLTDLYELGDLPHNTLAWVRHHGPVGAVLALYTEESGIPVLLPGDVFVVYLGRHTSGITSWIIAWLAMIAAVVLGATNLYWISRRWGHSLLMGKTGRALHLTHERLHRAETWFGGYGGWGLIFGRHIPGFRIPITVAAGTLEIRYAKFAASVAVSSAIWVGVFLYAGARYGRAVERLLLRHGRPFAIAIPVVIAIVVAVWAGRQFGRTHRGASPPTK